MAAGAHRRPAGAGHPAGHRRRHRPGEELDEAVLRDPASVRVFQLSVYAYLGYLQESLLEALPAERSSAPDVRHGRRIARVD